MHARITHSLLAAGLLAATTTAAADDRALDQQIAASERLLVLAPHPDDEVIGAAGLTQRVLARGGRVRTLIVTAGDGFIEALRKQTGLTDPGAAAYLAYGKTRIQEAKAASRVLGGGRIRLELLGFPDAFIAPLLSSHWNNAQPVRSDTTERSAVPYRELPQRNLAYSGNNLLRAIVHVLREFRPTTIAYPEPLDEHPDHGTVGQFGLLAVNEFMRGSRGAWPRLLSYLVHLKGWPPNSTDAAVDLTIDAPLELPAELPARGQARTCLTLSDDELARKRSAMAEHRTQQAIMPVYLAAFVRRTECFSVNTRVDAEEVERRVSAAPR